MYNALTLKIQTVQKSHKDCGETRVYVIRQAMQPKLNLYHYAVLFDRYADKKRELYVSDHGPAFKVERGDLFGDSTAFIRLPNIPNDIQDIKHFDGSLCKHYILGLNDCRHRTAQILDQYYKT